MPSCSSCAACGSLVVRLPDVRGARRIERRVIHVRIISKPTRGLRVVYLRAAVRFFELDAAVDSASQLPSRVDDRGWMQIQPHVYSRDMSPWRSWCLFVGLSVAAGCGTKANPAATCMQGTCIDPDFPYCDLDGSIGGTPGACIAVTCTAGEFSKCSGDNALSCNSFGTGYVQTQCAQGCDEGAGGCRLCAPNQTVCSNGVVATCDASGVQTSTTQCPLGCFEDQPRCRDIDPSNNLGGYLSSVANPPDVDLSAGGTIYVDTGEVLDSNSNPVVVPNFVAVQGASPPIRVFVVNHLRLGHVVINTKTSLPPPQTNPAVALLASNDITVGGNLEIRGGVGSLWSSDCSGGPGTFDISSPPYSQAASGGGGFATIGARGGNGGFVGGAGGGTSGNDTLVPLRGGCASGGHKDNNSSNTYDGTPGGGALQLVSRTKIIASANARIDVTGPGGNTDDHLGADGGGAGGA